jgi:tRNA nucleotidyltransferase (CCA-adding enzyme)
MGQCMLEKIPAEILEIIENFSKNNYQIYLVGGCVRNLLLDKKVIDWDMTTNAVPDQILKLFPDAFYDNTYGTVGIPTKTKEIEHQGVVEITTFRTEDGYSDKRRPDHIEWGKTIEEDLKRRDFTINAIAFQITTNPLRGEASDFRPATKTIDLFNGQADLNNKLIRCVGEPKQRFSEDALRLMRAIRFASQLGFTIEEKTLQAIGKNASLLAHIAKERIKDELLKILASEYAYEGIMLLKNTGLLEYILPELLEGIDISQIRPGRHHTSDVFTHNLMSLKHCPSIDPVVRFATLIHDSGKPRVASSDDLGQVIFYNHEVMGARMAYEICERLRFSKKDRQKVVTLIRWHMFTVDEHITDAAVRRFIRRIGVENVKDMMDLRIGDRLGGGTQTAESWRLKLFRKRIEEQLAPLPFSINDLAIDGNDVMKELNIKPSRRVGEILEEIFKEVDEDLSKNNREYLLQCIKEIKS